jgi:2-C-methyl-D-erythritol 2,4-cyclodiphosphate synthase
VTAPDDSPLVAIRTGLGYDSHRLAEGERLVLGGVEIPHHRGLVGHSDADALAHAICDALLGAAGLGDIGSHFPDTDPAYKDADSIVLLERVVRLVGKTHSVLNVDSTIHAERPKMAPYIPAMRARLADTLGLPVERVNVKAKTGEGVGAVGKQQAIETTAIATLLARDAV